jgi:enamine deaminase RidA (YjgF/YER057c/UK114 family)
MPIRRLHPEGRLAGAVVHGNTDPSLDAERPAHATVEARLVDARWRVRIAAVAALP